MHGDKVVVPVANMGIGAAMNVRGECAAFVADAKFGTGFVLHPVEGRERRELSHLGDA